MRYIVIVTATAIVVIIIPIIVYVECCVCGVEAFEIAYFKAILLQDMQCICGILLDVV
jgi:hypothetical protein